MKTIRSRIFEAFEDKKKLRFSDIEKHVKMRSNVLAYYIQKLQQEGVLAKEKEFYRLTEEAEKDIPVKGEKIAVPVVLVAAVVKGSILLLERRKRPYLGYWGLPGGKVLLNETLEDASLRILYKETGIMGKFRRINACMEERVGNKHGFILFLATVDAPDLKFLRKEGELQWFSIGKLPEKIIPSDRYLIENRLKTTLKVSKCEMQELDESYEAVIR